MRVTTVVNQKGGVGKTATAINVAGGLAELGRRVLLVDLDPQATLTHAVGVPDGRVGRSSYDLLLGDAEPTEAVMPGTGGVDLVPASQHLAGGEYELRDAGEGREFRLRRALAALAGPYDHAVVDCGPALGFLAINALVAADVPLVPCQPEVAALGGLKLIEQTIARVRGAWNPGLAELLVVPTMYDGRLSHHKAMLAALEHAYGGRLFPTPVRRSARVLEATSLTTTLLAHDARGDVARAYRQLAEVVDGLAA